MATRELNAAPVDKTAFADIVALPFPTWLRARMGRCPRSGAPTSPPSATFVPYISRTGVRVTPFGLDCLPLGRAHDLASGPPTAASGIWPIKSPVQRQFPCASQSKGLLKLPHGQLVLTVETLGAHLQQHLNRVSSPLSYERGGYSPVEPRGHRSVAQVVRALRQWRRGRLFASVQATTNLGCKLIT